LCTIRPLLLMSRALGEELRRLGTLIRREHVECLRDAGEDVHLHGALGRGLLIDQRLSRCRVVRIREQRLRDLQSSVAELLPIRRVLLVHLLRDRLQLIDLRIAEVECLLYAMRVTEEHNAAQTAHRAGIRLMAMESLRIEKGNRRQRERREDR